MSLVVIGVGDVVEKKWIFTLRLATNEGLHLPQVVGAELRKIPVRSGQHSTFSIFHPDPLHPGAVGEGPAIIAKVVPWLEIEWILGVSRHSEILIKPVMGGTVENRLGKINITEIVFISYLTIAIVKGHPDVVFAHSGSHVTVRPQHTR